ncbi:hypothetical protein F4604DRAFT_1690189 [Suillus subluteus]|nr:hypothetical protein F4604DRAFT_1690189 [Suillus subluteus]
MAVTMSLNQTLIIRSDNDEIDTLTSWPKYVKSIPDDCSAKGDICIIANSIGEIENILKRVIAAQDEILNFCGLSPEWHAADTVSRFLKTTVAYLEDIQLLEMSGGIVELTTAQWLGELMYQKGIKI